MKIFFTFLVIAISLFFGLISNAHSQSSLDAQGMAMCDRIKRQGVCEEYRLNTLPTADKQLITKHCTSNALCPDEDRIGRCLKYKDPDDVIFDKHFYRNVAKKEDWQEDFLEENCINNHGKYETD